MTNDEWKVNNWSLPNIQRQSAVTIFGSSVFLKTTQSMLWSVVLVSWYLCTWECRDYVSYLCSSGSSIQDQIEGTWRMMAVSAQKALQGSKFDIKELLTGTEEGNSVSRGGVIDYFNWYVFECASLHISMETSKHLFFLRYMRISYKKLPVEINPE